MPRGALMRALRVCISNVPCCQMSGTLPTFKKDELFVWFTVIAPKLNSTSFKPLRWNLAAFRLSFLCGAGVGFFLFARTQAMIRISAAVQVVWSNCHWNKKMRRPILHTISADNSLNEYSIWILQARLPGVMRARWDQGRRAQFALMHCVSRSLSVIVWGFHSWGFVLLRELSSSAKWPDRINLPRRNRITTMYKQMMFVLYPFPLSLKFEIYRLIEYSLNLSLY